MKFDQRDTIRDLSGDELNAVSGGIAIGPVPGGPTEPAQPFPPITLKGPIKPQPGPVPYLGPNPGPFQIG